MRWFQKWKLSTISFIVSALIILIYPFSISQSQQIILNPDPAYPKPVSYADLEKTRQIVEARLRSLNLAGSPGTAIQDKSIVLTLPKSVRTDIIHDLTQPGKINLIETGVEFPSVDATHRVRTGAESDPSQNIYQILLEAGDFVAARPLAQTEGDFGLRVRLSPTGSARLHRFLEDRRGVYLCLTQDDILIGCPIVKPLANNVVEIHQGPVDFLLDSQTLIDRINAGALPVPLVYAQATP